MKPQTQPTDEEMEKEHISTLMKVFSVETEAIKCQMKVMMRANGQAESSTNDDRSSTGSYKGKAQKEESRQHTVQLVVKQTTTHSNAELKVPCSVTFVTNEDMQQKPADTE